METGVWDKLTRVVITLLVIAGFLWVAVLYLPLIQQNEAMRKEIVNLDREIRQEEIIGRQLRSETDALKTDPKTVERLAREQLGLAKPGETVIRFEQATD